MKKKERGRKRRLYTCDAAFRASVAEQIFSFRCKHHKLQTADAVAYVSILAERGGDGGGESPWVAKLLTARSVLEHCRPSDSIMVKGDNGVSFRFIQDFLPPIYPSSLTEYYSFL